MGLHVPSVVLVLIMDYLTQFTIGCIVIHWLRLGLESLVCIHMFQDVCQLERALI